MIYQPRGSLGRLGVAKAGARDNLYAALAFGTYSDPRIVEQAIAGLSPR